MAQTQEQAEALISNNPQLIAHLKILISNVKNMEDVAVQQDRGDIITTPIYRELIAPDKEHMDMAIKNLAFKCGALSVETVTHQEYKDAKVDILIEKENNESKT